METTVAPIDGEKEGFVACRTSQGQEIQATLVHFTRYQAVLEIYAPALVLQMSEVLSDFRIHFQDRPVYAGRAVIRSLVNAGSVLVCEVSLEDGWMEMPSGWDGSPGRLSAEFKDFMARWQKAYKVRPEFKLVVADLQSLLADMRLWLDQVELVIRSSPNGERNELQHEAAHEIAGPVLPTIDRLGDRFEEIASQLEPDLRPVHIHFTRRQLHSALLCSPFAYRTYYKPLGYAGDYEMVNMIVRNPYEGATLFAKVINAWFLNQLPAQAHRNRLQILKQKLIDEAARLARLGRTARIFNLGCGPAGEVQEFLAGNGLCDNVEFTLLDFNEETLQHTSGLLRQARERWGRRTPIQFQKKSVQQLLKEAARAANRPVGAKYDFVYCAGLFDYLPDRVCKQLMGVFYDLLTPGGLLLVTNVDGTRAFRNKLEFILDWNLLYRNASQMAALKPEPVPMEDCSVTSDFSGVNLFLELRKPPHA